MKIAQIMLILAVIHITVAQKCDPNCGNCVDDGKGKPICQYCGHGFMNDSGVCIDFPTTTMKCNVYMKDGLCKYCTAGYTLRSFYNPISQSVNNFCFKTQGINNAMVSYATKENVKNIRVEACLNGYPDSTMSYCNDWGKDNMIANCSWGTLDQDGKQTCFKCVRSFSVVGGSKCVANEQPCRVANADLTCIECDAFGNATSPEVGKCEGNA